MGKKYSNKQLMVKRPSPEMIPSTENEIQYLIKNPPETRILRITPELHGKPVAMVSPLPYSPISNYNMLTDGFSLTKHSS
jgi:hypothetical protein